MIVPVNPTKTNTTKKMMGMGMEMEMGMGMTNHDSITIEICRTGILIDVLKRLELIGESFHETVGTDMMDLCLGFMLILPHPHPHPHRVSITGWLETGGTRHHGGGRIKDNEICATQHHHDITEGISARQSV